MSYEPLCFKLGPILYCSQCSLGPVVNIVAIFSKAYAILSYAYILKLKRIKRYHVKGIGSMLLILINMSFLTKKRKNKKVKK